MVKKIGKMAEIAWIIGTFLCAFGVVLCTKANFGLSMMAAPPYILHLTLVRVLPWFSQGTAQYLFEGLMLVVMCFIIRRFRPKFLLSFASGVVFGIAIDLWLLVLGGNGQFSSLLLRILGFGLGIGCISVSVAFMFNTYLPPQIPELLVMEVAKRCQADPSKIKLYLDVICLVVSVVLSLLLTGTFTGIGVGTVIITLANAPLIKLWSKLVEKLFVFDPMIPGMKKWLE